MQNKYETLIPKKKNSNINLSKSITYTDKTILFLFFTDKTKQLIGKITKLNLKIRLTNINSLAKPPFGCKENLHAKSA